jgi:uncharacterized protein YegP (UPF0339 family)
MRPSVLRERLVAGLRDFAWDEWGQMGVLAAPRRRSPWAQDPEALIVFTLDLAREDPRLFDEVMGWLLVNESLLSVRRLRAMCRDADDTRLLEAAVAWLASNRPRARLAARGEPFDGVPEQLFLELSTPVRDPDPAFLSAGLLRPVLEPSGKAGAPELRAPINLAFRLREFLGVSARAEIMRHLLTTDEPVGLDALVGSAGFARRNIQEALTGLHAAGVVSLLGGRGAQRYATDADAWSGLLGIGAGELPTHRAWPQLLGGLRKIARWLRDPQVEELSDYMLVSRARDLLEDVRGDFEQVGIRVGRTPGAGAWEDLESLVDQALKELDLTTDDRSGDPSGVLSRPFMQLVTDASGRGRWRLVAGNGQVLAISRTHGSTADARDAANWFIAAAPDLAYETFADSAGLNRWRAEASGAEVVAVSADAFTSKGSASRAAEVVQRVASTAVPARL